MICRYTSKEMADLWSEKNRFAVYFKIELLSTECFYKMGIVPEKDYQLIQKNATFNVDRIKELESVVHHDVVAFTRCISESLGDEAKWIHYGLTSTDVVDTANGYMLKQANELILTAYDELLLTVKRLANQYKNTPCIGRTHGVHADITSFGLKFAYFYDMLNRNYDKFLYVAKDVECGKISGAVGNYANVGMEVEQYVTEKLGINSANISTQVLSRERYGAYFSQIALIGSILEEMATEIRGLSRTEIGEVAEFFSKGQKGSSAMPHKKNPVSSENICGLSRLLRGYQLTAMENINLWHERDISHSSSERIIFMDGTTLIEYMLKRMNKILNELQVYPERMLKNIDLTHKVIFSQRVMTALINKGLTRENAYDLVQPLTFKATEEHDFLSLVKSDETICSLINDEEIDNLFTLDYYFKNVDLIYKKLGI